MKPGESIIINKVTLLIIPNDRLTRPICSKCKRHSPYRIPFITLFGMLFCSMQCIENFGEKRYEMHFLVLINLHTIGTPI